MSMDFVYPEHVVRLPSKARQVHGIRNQMLRRTAADADRFKLEKLGGATFGMQSGRSTSLILQAV
jgi:hypothetical protein